MVYPPPHPDFSILFTHINKIRMQQQLINLIGIDNHRVVRCADLLFLDKTPFSQDDEQMATEWLMSVFNQLFAYQHVTLVRGECEPEYFPATEYQTARIQFAHGFFASALHEISHWCIAGSKRRALIDFGYWYAPDGRSAAQQHQFEHLEIKPQALECLFTLACNRPFGVSLDNLFADFDTEGSTFAIDVYQQVASYIDEPHQLPRDAKIWLLALLMVNNSESVTMAL
ncbi:elongation factor P hydroxylase [Psychrobacter sp. GP33]|uniref:elongation factor P hydroxylase n=1 Tax=Psychrobacter sp. GP33 TaxID=2758709 RepID=UPI002174D362|nr:elongation factor P hydroxylase [Psychrobacter sp. GP33]